MGAERATVRTFMNRGLCAVRTTECAGTMSPATSNSMSLHLCSHTSDQKSGPYVDDTCMRACDALVSYTCARTPAHGTRRIPQNQGAYR